MSGRIVLTAPYAWPHVRRGAESVMHGLASWLHGTGWDVHIVAGGPDSTTGAVDGVPVHFVRSRDATRVHRDLDAEVTILPAVAARVRALRPDLIHAFGFPDAAAVSLTGLPYVVGYHGMALARSFQGRPVRRALLRRSAAGAKALLSPSRAAAAHLAEEFGLWSEVLPNGLCTSALTSSPSVPAEPGTILCAATPDDRRKRVAVLVAAFARLATRRDDVCLRLAGACSEQTASALLGPLPPAVRDRITVVGDCPPATLAGEYARAAITCLPSLHEAFGMVVVESFAAGTPVAAADHGALPELVGEGTGSLFTPDDPEACAKALEAALDLAADPATARRCQAAAAPFDWSVIGPRHVDLYERVG